MKRRQWLGMTILVALSGIMTPLAGQAQTPSGKTIRLVVPFPPGGATDITARVLAEPMSKVLNQPVVVENKGGAGGSIGMADVAKSAPDGLTYGMATLSTHGVNPAVYSKLPYDPIKDFAAVTELVKAPGVLVVNASLPVLNFQEFVAYLKANPGKLSHASPGNGTIGHMWGELFKASTGTQMQHVIYKETTQLYTGVANGELAFALGTSATAGALQRAGKLRFMAVAAPRRIPAFKDVPTVAEAQGPANFEVSGWTAIAAPRGLPKAVADKIQRDIEKALAEADIKDKYLSFGYESFPTTREQFNQYMQSESVRFADVIKKAGASLD